MALIKCYECNRDVSTEAKTCPGCGATVKVPLSKQRVGWKGALLLLFLVFGVLPAMISNMNSSGTATAPGPSPSQLKQQALVNVALDFKWSKIGGGNLMQADFKVTNKGKVTVKDVEITCDHSAPSGTRIDSNKRTIYETVQAGKSRSFPNFDMGFIHSQAAQTSCVITDLVVVN